ncbi:uncharacterized protein BX663DRAFT_506810, partial [Cokeromyces recurvatus]|uniref:uncharacterized protein n=1 Tax=Cokeromyces recurvatus TaxID=90255 RepID=UPI00221ED391
MMEHMSRLFEFYGFNTARYGWKNYVGSQIAIETSVNILLNGGNKYNKDRRKNTKKARRVEDNQEERAAANSQLKRCRKNKSCFEEGDRKKMPLVIFGVGLQNKDHIKFK